jgi:hypothetical protein
MRDYLYSVSRAFSRLINSIFGGYSGETISGRAWRTNIYWMISLLDCVWYLLGDGRDHCYKSYLLDKHCMDKPKKEKK